MNKTKLLLLTFLMTMLPLSSVFVSAAPVWVQLSASYNDPNSNDDDSNRSPVLIPEVSLDDHTLTFDDSCIGCTLRLVNAEGEVEYTTVITSSTLVLPSTLEGEFEIQIIRDNWCFYGYIEL